jgi:hypothetical protein
MTQDEYDKQFKSKTPLQSQEVVGSFDGVSVSKITVIEASPQEMHQQEMEELAKGGADYSGNEEFRHFMQRYERVV